MTELPRKAKGQRPVYFGDRAVDNILSMVMALMGEVVVLRERLDSAERLLEQGDVLQPKAVDTFQPSPEAIEERDAWRAQFLDIVLRSVQQELEALEERADQRAYDQNVELVTAA
ncbi:MAG: hypothetical protein AB7G25_06115 [Sphingomonadaceae bacterium]